MNWILLPSKFHSKCIVMTFKHCLMFLDVTYQKLFELPTLNDQYHCLNGPKESQSQVCCNLGY